MKKLNKQQIEKIVLIAVGAIVVIIVLRFQVIFGRQFVLLKFLLSLQLS